jgi:hypothetical protein
MYNVPIASKTMITFLVILIFQSVISPLFLKNVIYNIPATHGPISNATGRVILYVKKHVMYDNVQYAKRYQDTYD